MLIAVQPDTFGFTERENSALQWTHFLREAGQEVRTVDVFRHDILEQLEGCRGLMWRTANASGDRAVARRLLPVLENELGLEVYPSHACVWHYDDKLAQYYLLKAVGIPTPDTWVFWRKDDALEFARNASYPLVLKLAMGSGSSNVRLIRDFTQARRWIKLLFSSGVFTLDTVRFSDKLKDRAKRKLKKILRGEIVPEYYYDLQKNYIIFQEFLHENPFDYRITVIGNRVFGLRRYNRPNDFRASGSGLLDYDREQIEQEMLRLSCRLAKRLRMHTVAIDGLKRNGQHVVSEISYTFPSVMVADSPGHWILEGEPDTGELKWCEGPMPPEKAEVEDFLERLKTPSDPSDPSDQSD